MKVQSWLFWQMKKKRVLLCQDWRRWEIKLLLRVYEMPGQPEDEWVTGKRCSTSEELKRRADNASLGWRECSGSSISEEEKRLHELKVWDIRTTNDCVSYTSGVDSRRVYYTWSPSYAARGATQNERGRRPAHFGNQPRECIQVARWVLNKWMVITVIE